MIWINENVLGSYGSNLAQHFFHLKETQGEERFMIVGEEGFSKRAIPHPGKKSDNNLTPEFPIKADLHNKH